MAGIYVHIPFCESRCIYCGFYSTTHPELMSRYVSCVLRELQLRAHYLDGEGPVSTIYLGGGTPSMLSDECLTLLITTLSALVDDKNHCEITVECNPEDVTKEFAQLLCRLPVNRVSMGAQTFDDGLLRFIHRRHTAKQTVMAVERLRDAGISNLSLDLMFGFPGETTDLCKRDLDILLSLKPEHISTYSLQYEEGTTLRKLLDQGKVEAVSDEDSLAMYNAIVDRLEANGYEHYEISNFALPGFRSKHNSSYWQDVAYLGLGAAAHSYNHTSRQWNVSNIMKYMTCIENGKLPSESEIITPDTHYDDIITTAMRTREGVKIERLEPKYRRYILVQAEKWIEQGKLILEDGSLHLTRAGLYISDMIMSDLMYV